jgi:hypothetical protein
VNSDGLTLKAFMRSFDAKLRRRIGHTKNNGAPRQSSGQLADSAVMNCPKLVIDGTVATVKLE